MIGAMTDDCRSPSTEPAGGRGSRCPVVATRVREPVGERLGHGRGRARGHRRHRAILRVDPSGITVELLLADNSHAHMLRMAATAPTGAPPGCGVDSPHQCPRRGGRRCSATPTVKTSTPARNFGSRQRARFCLMRAGVDHGAHGRCDPRHRRAGCPHPRSQGARPRHVVQAGGARIGLLRVIAETELQAATDGLTGLLNRRSFERKVSLLRRDGKVLSLGCRTLTTSRHSTTLRTRNRRSRPAVVCAGAG